MFTEITEQTDRRYGKDPTHETITQRYIGAYTTLKSAYDTLYPSLPAGTALNGIQGDYITGITLQRTNASNAELIINSAKKNTVATWNLTWIEIQKDIHNWHAGESNAPEVAKVKAWEALTNDPEAYTSYRWRPTDAPNGTAADYLTGDTLTMAQMITKGITGYSRFAPILTKTTTSFTLPENYGTNIGKQNTPTSGTETNVDPNISDYTALATKWLKTQDTIQTTAEGAKIRTEIWRGADDIDPNLYPSAD